LIDRFFSRRLSERFKPNGGKNYPSTVDCYLACWTTNFNSIWWGCSWGNLQQKIIFISLHSKTYAWILCNAQ